MQRTPITLLIPLLALALLISCDSVSKLPSPGPTEVQASSPQSLPAPDAPLLLKHYTLPPGYGKAFVFQLQRLMRRKGEAIGQAQLMPKNTLVVLATDDIHNGVQALLASLPTDPKDREPSDSVHAHYWVLQAQHTTDDARTRSGPISKDLHKALNELEDNAGPMRFKLLERVSLRSALDLTGEISGDNATIQHTYTAQGDELLASINVRFDKRSSLTTDLRMRSGQTIILGMTGTTINIPERERITIQPASPGGIQNPAPLSDEGLLIFVARAVHTPADPTPQPPSKTQPNP